VLYCVDYRFHQRILENSWIFIKKNRDTLNTKHFQNSIVYYLLLYFLVILTSFFCILPVYSFQKKLKFLCCFIVWIRYFIKKFCKTMIFFSRKIQILEIKNFIKIPSFFFYFLTFLAFYVLFHLSKLVQKLWNFL